MRYTKNVCMYVCTWWFAVSGPILWNSHPLTVREYCCANTNLLTYLLFDEVCEFACIFIAEDKRLMEDHKQEVDALQRKVSELQAEYKLELNKAKNLSEVCYIIICLHFNEHFPGKHGLLPDLSILFAPCRLQGGNVPWLICWFWRYINCLMYT